MERWKIYEFSDCIINNNVGKANQINASEIRKVGKYPVIDQGQDFIAGYSDEKDKLVNVGLPYVIFGDHTRCFKYIDFPFIVGADGTKILSPNTKLFAPKFFYFQLLSFEIPSRGYNRHYKLLKEKYLYKPELLEQRKIAYILSTVQRTIEQQEKLIRTTTELKKALMQKLFTEGLYGEKQKQTEIGLVPESWEIKSFDSEKILMQYGTSIKCDYSANGFPVVRIPNIIDGKIDLTDLKYGIPKPNEIEKLKLENGDLIFVRTNGAKELTGRCSIFNNEIENCYYASYLIRVKFNNEINPQFINYYTQTYIGKSFLSGKANRTADGKFNINTGTLNNVLFPKPSLTEQNEIVKIVCLLEDKIIIQTNKKGKYTSLFKTLLNELMTGQRRVNDIEFEKVAKLYDITEPPINMAAEDSVTYGDTKRT
jgi:type I restriction enzyme S subunit